MTSAELRTERIRRGRSIRGLAREIGVPANAIARIESGLNVRLETAKAYADWHDIDIFELPAIDEPEDVAA